MKSPGLLSPKFRSQEMSLLEKDLMNLISGARRGMLVVAFVALRLTVAPESSLGSLSDSLQGLKGRSAALVPELQ